MKKIFTALICFVMCLVFVFAIDAKTNNPNFENMHVFIVGSPSVGTAALAESLASQGAIVIVQSDGDGIAEKDTDLPLLANKYGAIPIATAEQILLAADFKIEPEKIQTNYPNRIFYDLPPNDAFTGQSFANPIRAQPRG